MTQSRSDPRLIGRRLEFTHGFEYDGTPVVVRCYQPMLIVESEEGPWAVPAAACVVDAHGYVRPKRPDAMGSTPKGRMTNPAEGQMWCEARTGPPPPGSYRDWTWTLTRPGPRPGDWYGLDRDGHEKFLRREWFESGRLELLSYTDRPTR